MPRISSLSERVERILKRTMSVGECLLWAGPVNEHGYGVVGDSKAAVRGYVHRLVWEQVHGPIPEGMVLDHVCHGPGCEAKSQCLHRRCLNLRHLRLVTRSENAARQDRTWRAHCPQGHPYTEENTYVRKNGLRQCRTCRGWKGLRYA